MLVANLDTFANLATACAVSTVRTLLVRTAKGNAALSDRSSRKASRKGCLTYLDGWSAAPSLLMQGKKCCGHQQRAHTNRAYKHWQAREFSARGVRLAQPGWEWTTWSVRSTKTFCPAIKLNTSVTYFNIFKEFRSFLLVESMGRFFILFLKHWHISFCFFPTETICHIRLLHKWVCFLLNSSLRI